MFEVYGWASIGSDTYEIDGKADAELLSALRSQIEQAETVNMSIRLDTGMNGDQHVLTVVGMKNHKYPPVLELFGWLARHGLGSYGLLYIRDDEDWQRGGDYTNEFRVWRLARGRLEEFSDPFLSPCIPTVEDAFDGDRE